MGRKKHPLIIEVRICEECNETFEVNEKNKKRFCSGICAKRNNGKRNKGRTFSDEINKKKGHPGEKNPFFGKTHSNEVKEIIRNTHLGKKHTNEHNKKISEAVSGEKNPFYGKKHTLESRAKISINHMDCKGKNNPMFKQGDKIKGNKNGSWKGGITNNPYDERFNEELKTKIRKRDKFTCAICNKHGYCVHHIDYNKQNSIEENLITLCISDHMKTNFNRESWIKFFNEYKLNENKK